MMPELMKLYTCIGNDPDWPDPTPEHFADPRFDLIWNAIKKWDINRGDGAEGATGNHVRAILDALAGEAGSKTAAIEKLLISPQEQIDWRTACRAASGLRR
jgi:hypothetical protein